MAKFLIDTNIFLEILLAQERKEKCKAILNKKIENICISDFSLHSIGVILFKLNQHEQFNNFLKDVLPNVTVIHLPVTEYGTVSTIALKYKLDFDDAYQTTVAKFFKLKVDTMDKDFKKVATFIDVEILK